MDRTTAIGLLLCVVLALVALVAQARAVGEQLQADRAAQAIEAGL